MAETTRILEWPRIKKEAMGFAEVNTAGTPYRGETARMALDRGREEGFQGGVIWGLRWLGAVPVLNPITMSEDGLAVLDDSIDRCPWCDGPVLLVPFIGTEWWVACTSVLCEARGPKGQSEAEAVEAFRRLVTQQSGGELPS